VALSIAVGVFAVGAIATSQVVLSRDLAESYLATNPANATIFAVDRFDDDLVETVERIPEIAEAEARRSVMARIQVGPDEWRALRLIAIPDYNQIKIDQIAPEAGAWPPPNNEMLIERGALGLTNAQVGETVLVKAPDGKERPMRIAGLVHDLTAQMFIFDGTAYGFITFDTLEWLGESRDYDELRIVVAGPTDDRAYIQRVADRARDKIEASGREVMFVLVPEPGKHVLDFLIQAIAVIMGALGVLSLLLSGFLVVNTISALLTQQTRQIGMMKAVGARTGQVMQMYLVTVVIFGLLALLIAVPLGVAGAYYFSRYVAGFLNFDVENFRLPAEVLALQVGVGLLVPLIAAFVPILLGVRVTVREAISEYGLGKGHFGTSRIDRLLMRTQWLRLSRPLVLSLRNTFRRKGRLALTLMTLTFAGAIFIAVFSVRASLLDTLDSWLDYFQYDVGVRFDRDYRLERVIREALKTPGIVTAEAWGFYNGRRLRPDDTDSDSIVIFAPPAETKLIKPTLVAGRWLQAEDRNAVVVNTLFLRDEPDVALGHEIILKINGREETWQVVGVVSGGALMATVFVNYPYFAEVAHDVNRAQWVFAISEQHDLAYQTQVARAMERHFEHIGLRVSLVAMMEEERAETEAIFQVIVVMLLLMAVLLAIIGGLGLMGTMSVNVLERTREIGVVRAIGASDGAVQWLFIVEGILIGLLSWLIGSVLAYPIGLLLSSAVGTQFLGTSLHYTFSIGGVVVWLVTVVVLSAVASFLPAWNASRLTVREVLAYE
jgi:putative ABC transport system permease protein